MTLTGSANDDSGNTQSNPAGSSGAPPSSPANPSGSVTNPTPSSVTAAAAAAPKSANGSPPGARLQNPLGQLSSYTYQLSLYMMTTDAYGAFIASGRKSINIIPQTQAGSPSVNTGATTNPLINPNTGQPVVGGAYLIAQSGGSGSPINRAPGFKYDYGIDSLTFNHMVSSNETGAAALNTEMKFQITEPYGFSFLDNLKTAQTVIESYNGAGNTAPNASKQFFILGIRFYGYNPDGTVATGKETFSGTPLDPSASGNGALFETFYDILIKKLSFKIGAEATVYHIEANPIPTSVGFGLTKGYSDSPNFTCKGTTVGEILNDLTTQLNAKQQQLVTTGNGQNPPQQYPVTYRFEYQGNAALTIQNASMVNPADNDKAKSGMANVSSSMQSNPKAEVTGVYNPNVRTITFPSQPILQCIDQAITSSTYVTDALSFNTTSSTDGDNAVKPNPNPKYPVWYSCSTRLENPRWDKITNDWAFDIVYVIQEYLTPMVDSPLINKTQPYYGPFKRYNYWYTGKNSEVLDYSQTFDNAFYNVILGGQGPDPLVGAPTTSPTAVGQSTPQSSTNTLGSGAEAVASYKGSLYDPASYTHAKITILGDPDFLIQESAVPSNLYDQHYGPNGYTVNPNGGQVFIEINFNEAIDYDTSAMGTGLLNLNNKVLFQPYNTENLPKDANGNSLVQGVSYRVNRVDSTFSSGTFKQTFEMVVNQFNGTPAGDTGSTTSNANPGPSTTNATNQAPTTGLAPVPQNSTPHGTISQTPPAQQAPAEPTT